MTAHGQHPKVDAMTIDCTGPKALPIEFDAAS
jgi:hypothetical protein